MLTDICVGNQTRCTAVFIQKLLDDSSPRPHLTHFLLSLENVFLCLHLLFVFSCLLYMLCCHLFALLNSFTVLFSPQCVLFQSIFPLLTYLFLSGVCILAFGLCPLSQQIFVYGLFCSYLTVAHQCHCLCCTGISCL